MEPIILGQTGLQAGRLGLGAAYGAPAAAFEEAFEKGCNYFYWTSRKSGMREAIQNICKNGHRDRLIIAVQSYSRSAFLLEHSVKRALKSLAVEYADILLLGWHNKAPANRLMDKAVSLKQKGLVRFLGMSGHNRSLFPGMNEKGVFDLFHIRYNAAHRGAETETFPFLRQENGPGIVTYTATRWGHLLKPKYIPPGETPPTATDCYRFVLTHPAVDVCLCGPKNIDQGRGALKALELGPMNKDEMARMKKIGDHVHAHAGRFF
jgi:aryl-alcohol dehydrogenase-like predicted oxidoreductase